MVYRRKGKRTVRRSKKLGAVLKRDGIFKGSGNYVGMQLGGPLGKAAKTIVPAMLLLTVASAITPPLGSALASSVRRSGYGGGSESDGENGNTVITSTLGDSDGQVASDKIFKLNLAWFVFFFTFRANCPY